MLNLAVKVAFPYFELRVNQKKAKLVPTKKNRTMKAIEERIKKGDAICKAGLVLKPVESNGEVYVVLSGTHKKIPDDHRAR